MSGVDDLDDLRASFRDVLADAAAAGDIRRHVNEGASRCESLWRKAAELGWFALLTPEIHGGLGLGRAAAAVLYEEMGRVTAPLPVLGALAATEIVAAFGDGAQCSEWLPRLAAGESATFAADAEDADLIDGDQASLLLARQSGGPWMLGAPVAVERIELFDRTRSLARARLDSAASKLAGSPERIARTLRIHANMALACDSVGGAKAVLEETIQYLKTREQFGKPVGSFQALKHRCAEHKVAVAAAEALLASAVARWDCDDVDADLYAMLVKALACDMYAAVATDAVQLHGGIGFTWEHDCHLYLKRAKLNQTLFGSAAVQWDGAARLMVSA
ncbi:MAG TPA: acyl-CoA dehydrogenase family protein [Caulobacterales bacterium]|nr:acyl-CoA dehydrogenase family protein [Caulobacterales bacterium]